MANYSLQACPLFAGLSEVELAALNRRAEVMDIRVGTSLFKVGDPADAFYLVSHGSVRIDVPATAKEPAKQVTLRDGAFFGEIGLVRDCPRTASAFADFGARVVKIPRKAFLDLMQHDAKVARKIALAILDRLNEFEGADAGRRDAKEPQVMMVLSTGNREGASFLSANLAVKFRLATKLPVLGIDMNFGDQGMWRYLETMSNLGSFAPIIEAEKIDAATIEKALDRVPSGVALISGHDAERSDALRPRHVHEMIKAARERYQYILIEVGKEETLLNAEVARSSDAALIVCMPTEVSIAAADAKAEWLRGQGLDGRIRFVVNRIPKNPEVDPAAIKKVLGDDLLGTIRRSEVQFELGRNASAPVVQARPDSELAVEITRVCQAIRAGDMLGKSSMLGKVRDLMLWGFGFTD